MSKPVLALTWTLAVSLILTITLETAWLLPTTAPAGAWSRLAWECLVMAIAGGLPAVALTAGLLIHTLPARPALAGALLGLGLGVMTDAGVRLFCWISTPSHVLAAHGAAIATLVLAAAAISVGLDRVKGAPGRDLGRRVQALPDQGRHRGHHGSGVPSAAVPAAQGTFCAFE